MFPAILTAVLFAFSAVVSQRATRIFGALQANAWRLCIACLVLGLVTWITDSMRGETSLHSEVFGRYFLSGAVGFGLGDIALFLAYARLGSRLTILINWCAAALFAAGGDLWLRDRVLSLPQWAGIAGILAGLSVALWPSGAGARRQSGSGMVFAVLAGIGMGMGTVLSGRANDLAAELHVSVHGISQAFQRCSAGVAAGLLALLFANRFLPARRPDERQRQWRHRPFWLLSAALIGPVLGVSCYQWALLTLGSSAMVVALAATSTLLVIPLARLVEKDRPAGRQLAGTLLAAAGVVVLHLFGRQ